MIYESIHEVNSTKKTLIVWIIYFTIRVEHPKHLNTTAVYTVEQAKKQSSI